MNLNKLPNVHVLAGLGNPLLDVSVILKNNSILEQYNLKPDGQKEVRQVELADILASLKSEGYDLTYNPGGCAQNTLRIVQFLVGHPSFCVMFGGIGIDENGCTLESQLNNAGVVTRYAKHSNHMTGQVAALINGESRSLVAHLGAAEFYTLEDFKTPENLKLTEEIYLVYIEGFFITHSCDVALEVIQFCRKYGVVVVFNICGAYVADVCPEDLVCVASAADIVIGNKEEFGALAKILRLKEAVNDEVAVQLHQALWKQNDIGKFKLDKMVCFGKTLVITQGKDSVLCVCGDRKLIKHNVPYLDPDCVKDPTGAGDAFAAGFLVAFITDKTLIDCLSFGCSVAGEVIQHIGIDLRSLKSNSIYF